MAKERDVKRGHERRQSEKSRKGAEKRKNAEAKQKEKKDSRPDGQDIGTRRKRFHSRAHN